MLAEQGRRLGGDVRKRHVFGVRLREEKGRHHLRGEFVTGRACMCEVFEL